MFKARYRCYTVFGFEWVDCDIIKELPNGTFLIEIIHPIGKFKDLLSAYREDLEFPKFSEYGAL
jgi:hypothetical protein